MKSFNNTAGTTSSEFSIGVGATNVRHMVLGAVCTGSNTIANDKEGNSISIAGVEFFDMKILGVDRNGNRITKHIRGTAVGSTVKKIEDTFEEGFDGGVQLAVSNNTLIVTCLVGSTVNATYSIYVTLQRIE
jgi:hypothetical protein